jgi:hypothetical protein
MQLQPSGKYVVAALYHGQIYFERKISGFSVVLQDTVKINSGKNDDKGNTHSKIPSESGYR